MKTFITSTLAFTLGLGAGAVGTIYAVRDTMKKKGLSYEKIVLGWEES